jgi:integrase/recombinase XerD
VKAPAKLVAEYLDMRRALGFKAEREKWILSSFVAFLQTKRSGYVTTEHALAWARQPSHAHPTWWAKKLSVVRVFAKYVHLLDPRHEIPPRDLLPREKSRRTTPSIYSPEEIARLLQATRNLQSRRTSGRAFRRATYETLFGLIAATGMRVGEAIRLDCSDIDWRNQLVVVRESKFRKSREVLLHRSVIRVLRRYAKERDRAHSRSRSPSFFVSLVGTRLIYNNVHTTFARLLRHAGISRAKARVHDLRHTFVVRTVLRWHREGADVDARMPALSTYLGHRSPSSTYWYLTAAPELMALVGRKIERTLGDIP